MRYTTGRKYRALSSEEVSSTPSTHGCADCTAPAPRNHLVTNPAVGGSPIMPAAPTVNAAEVHGMRRPRPSIWSIRETPTVSLNSPAAKNRVIFMRPWCTRCTMPPVVPTTVATVRPRVT